ncbi:MAG: hypothetical protein GY810_15520 [Aureispira sp.]|nr:hypothetical protein [Aureispira sp.]
MKQFITLLFFMTFCTAISVAQSQKTFIKSLPLDGNQNVTLAAAGNVQVSEWDKDYIRITTTVEVLNFNEDILKRLVAVGRYSLESTTKDGALIVTMPKIATQVTIKGSLLKEVFKYEIQVPKNVTVDTQAEDATTTAEVN